MNHMAQIRRTTSTLRANPVLPQTQNLKISNRESLRLEINVTRTKQTTQSRSNRELEALFSNRVRAVNRLRDCGGIDRLRDCGGIDRLRDCGGIDSARRYRVWAVNPLCDFRPIDSARRNRVWADDSARGYIDERAKTSPPEPGIRDTRRSSIIQFNKQFRKRSIKAPSKNVSVRKKSTERFQQLTQILIDTMFRLEILARRTRGERIETGGIPQTA
jgi:hypothetical protein